MNQPSGEQQYVIDKLKEGYYIDAHCPRPYSKYKNAIEVVANIILNK